MNKLKYVKSKHFNEHYYECCNCGKDNKTFWFEFSSGINCTCGAVFTKEDVVAAKDEYIAKIENAISGANLELLSESIAFRAANKIREYHGRETRESNEFIKELSNEIQESISKHIESEIN